MKKSLKISSVPLFVLFVLFVFFAFVSADTGNVQTGTSISSFTGTLSQFLIQEKSEVNTLFNATYQRVYANFQRSGLNLMKSLNYKSLVCLGVMNKNTPMLLELQKDKEQIKFGFLRDFLGIESDIATLEEKVRVLQESNISLFEQGTNYDTEKAKIIKKITDTVDLHQGLIRSFETSYAGKITTFGQDIIEYSLQNSGIVGYINDKLYKLDDITAKLTLLTSEIERINSFLLGSGSSFFENMSGVKISLITTFDRALQPVIARYVKRYKVLKTLSGMLASEKEYTLRLYGLDFDEKLSTVLGQWYDKTNYDFVKNEMAKLSHDYMVNKQLNCMKVFENTINFDTHIKTITDTLYPMTANIQSGINQAQSSGSAEKVKSDLLTQFTVFNTNNLKKYITDFQKLIKDKVKLLLKEKRTGTTTSSTITPVSSSSSVSPFFTRPFNKGEKGEGVKTLQTLLKNNGYYAGEINSIFTQETLQAVYKFQLKNGLLAGYEKKPATWGRMGPSTRAKLNELAQKISQ